MARPLLGIISLIFLGGSIVLQFLLILSGGISSSPEPNIYFLQSTTNGIPNAPNPARWTYWSICGVDGNGVNANCGATVPALPFSPSDHTNFDTTTGVPGAFVNTNYYYLMSRFAWVFFLLALIFSVGSMLTGLLALCTRLGAYISGLNAFIAFGWQALAAALMTAWTVKARNVWLNNGQDAWLGKYAYGFAWAPVVLLFLSTATFFSAGSHSRTYYRGRKEYV